MAQKGPIVIVDYGLGNLGAIHNMFKHLGVASIITGDLREIENATKVVIAGVGAFDTGMKNLEALKITPLLQHKVLQERVPILGICLGMQLFTRKSEEGTVAGLGWFAADTVRFRFTESSNTLKIPHMGWNHVRVPEGRGFLFSDLDVDARFYFVHSYHCVCDSLSDSVAVTDYGYEFTAAVEKENIFGVQFHPEKSHRYGMKLLENFARLV